MEKISDGALPRKSKRSTRGGSQRKSSLIFLNRKLDLVSFFNKSSLLASQWPVYIVSYVLNLLRSKISWKSSFYVENNFGHLKAFIQKLLQPETSLEKNFHDRSLGAVKFNLSWSSTDA